MAFMSEKQAALLALDAIVAAIPPGPDPTVTVTYRNSTDELDKPTPDERRLERLRSPNGDPYRAEHLRDIGEDGLRRLYERDKISADELDRLLGDLLAAEPDPLDD